MLTGIYYAYGGDEHWKRNYEVLVNSGDVEIRWVQGRNGSVPRGAFSAGYEEDGEELYVGRHWHEGALVVGKVHLSHGYPTLNLLEPSSTLLFYSKYLLSIKYISYPISREYSIFRVHEYVRIRIL